MKGLTHRARGFSLLEMVVALALLMGLLAGLAAVLDPSQGAFTRESEAADVEQRLRVAVLTLTADLRMAGSGPSVTADGPLLYALAPVLPYRRERAGGDPPGSYRTDAVTIVSAVPSPAQATLAEPWSAADSAMTLDVAGCPTLVGACGFAAGDTALVADGAGDWDIFAVSAIDGAVMTGAISSRAPDEGTAYPAGSMVVKATLTVYALKINAAGGERQLIVSRNASADVPVVDHLVDLQFEYYGDPNPPTLVQPVAAPTGPWTTYGPPPPPRSGQRPGYADGENCVFQSDPGGGLASRLPSLGGRALVRLGPDQLTDGPWCSDEGSAGRWDADLLRVRAVVVRLRVEAANESLRGPAGVLFARGGSSRAPAAFVPDREVRFAVAPRNLNLVR